MNSSANTTAPGVTTARVQARDWVDMQRPTVKAVATVLGGPREGPA
jgi:hypothetical protein